jgi:iron-sulfur cluster protein
LSDFGRKIRLNRILGGPDHKPLVVAFDHALPLGPIPGTVDPATQVESFAEAGVDAVLLNPGMIRHCVKAFLQPEAPSLIVRMDWSSLWTSFGVDGQLKSRSVATPEQALRNGADAVLSYLLIGTGDVEFEANEIARNADLARECEALGIPLIVESLARGKGIKNSASPDALKLHTRIAAELGADEPSHIVVPALHVNRTQVREIFACKMNRPELTDDLKELTEAARSFLRERFLRVSTAISGANFLVAETGSVVIVESEGNGRMCLTLPQSMITLAGIEKVIPRFQDLEIMLQVLARSATGERMNPYSSLWTGVTPGDGPQRFHVVLLDHGRSEILAKGRERQTLKCIRCGACQNTCPVYRQTGGHAYGSPYGGPIGAILTPQLMHLEHAQTLPYASSLCGACYDVCPVKINIPEILIDLRAQVTDKERDENRRFFDPMYLGMRIANFFFLSEGRFRLAQRIGRLGLGLFTRKDGWIHSLPLIGARWTMTRDLRGLPRQTFREWWATRAKDDR